MKIGFFYALQIIDQNADPVLIEVDLSYVDRLIKEYTRKHLL